MKRVKINAYTIGLVFRNKEYVKCLSAGSHWIGWNATVQIYDLTKSFYAPVELNILLQDNALAALLTVVEVKDNQIAMQYINGNYSKVLMPGRYAVWNSVVDYEFKIFDTSKLEVQSTIDQSVLTKTSLLSIMKVFSVDTFEKGLLFVNGEFVKELSAGVYRFWKNTNVVSMLKIDMRQKQLEISGQELLTKDKAGLRLNMYAQYKVINAQKALIENKNFEKQLYIYLQLALREFVGTLTLDELLANKEAIATYVLAQVKAKAKDLGVQLIDCGVRDIILPGDMKDIMNQVLIAQKQAQANTILRREESAATRSLLNTAKLMEDNAMLLKLKEMEYVEKIAEKIGEITVSGKSQIVDQLSEIFVSK